jgi:hypothetical protein
MYSSVLKLDQNPESGSGGMRFEKITLGIGIEKIYDSGPGLKTDPVLEH